MCVATATDNCNVIVTFSDVSTQGTVGCSQYQYSIDRTWTATDDCGNAISFVQTINVVDTQAPMLVCPGNITVGNDAGLCGADVTVIATVSDNCSANSEITMNNNSGYGAGTLDASGYYAVGMHMVTFTATDA